MQSLQLLELLMPMDGKWLVGAFFLGFVLAACTPVISGAEGPVPEPIDVESPRQLSTQLKEVRILWSEPSLQGNNRILVNLDGTHSVALPTDCGSPSPDGRYLICIQGLGDAFELLDLETGERKILIRKDESFPSALSMQYPRFTPDGKAVLFSVTWQDFSDPVTLDLETGKAELIDAPGLMNTEPVLSADGRWILVACEGRKLSAGLVLCVIDLESRARTYLVDEAVNLLPGSQLTPDDRYALYVALEGGSVTNAKLFRIRVADKEKKLLVSGLSSANPILAVSNDSVIFACTLPERPACSWVCVVDLEGKEVRRLTYLGESCIDLDAP